MTTPTSILRGRPIAAQVDWQSTYAELLPRVYSFFRYRFGDDLLAEDLTSATFEKAWRARSSYRRDIAAFSTWVFTIARNVATDELRRQRVQLAPEKSAEPSDEPSPEAAVARQADLQRLEMLLQELPPRERELIALKYGAEMTNREIAKLTGLGESNVGTILHRVVHGLRNRWEGQP